MTELLALQNGSDIRGIAISHEEFTANLTKKEAQVIASGIIEWLKSEKKVTRTPMRIAIGHDSRLSASDIKGGLVEGFIKEEVEILDAELATTPAMFMATQFEEFDADCGIMITASHLPFYYNGIKLFSKDGGAEHEDIDYILAHTTPFVSDLEDKGSVTKKEIISLYSADLVRKIQQETGEEKPLSGFKIVLDAGNGAGGFFAEKVLQVLGADTSGSQFLDPDGHFPNHMPNPDNKEAMESIQQAVLKNKADLGVIFDTDVDRAAVVDKTGEVINRNSLIAVLAQIVLENETGQTIVTNSPTSSHLKSFIEELGGKQVRYLCGYRNVINKAIELNNQGIETPLAIETSGHAAFKENYFLDDGAYVIAKILMLLPKLKKENKTIGDLIATLKQPVEAQEVRFKISGEAYRVYGNEVIEKLRDFVSQEAGFTIDSENEEGIRVNVSETYGSGWFLLRMSLHEPLLVLQVENDELNKNKVVFTKLATYFNQQERLNTEKLAAILED
ncbi:MULTISPECIES: phosphomannomutase/phosphoglucomutase [Vagococcus]|uniref:Phosphoglucosamine mutase n=1 Tax=Vagococcus fluvialis bH819 TaxID=1255619 RepID=A0A1X6WPT5_9ENTE|nr:MULTISPECIES: phosphomannomutase/phosphoglucomutase [Vagococcus]SLM85666.1 Phosphoglucosamine mutase [Vagococcus fluvialis bH819]HCM89633.1 phosphomannomutase/phosphoglucomutase [Vagococcus sp.]